MKLAIISHTEHYRNQDGDTVGWGPTISEINHLIEAFETIYHVAMLYEDKAPSSALPYTSDRIKFVALPPSGGRTFKNKLNIVVQAPKVISLVRETLNKVDCFQLRTPTGIGVYLIPYLSLFSKKKGWYKYAGNWNQKNPPLGYRLQRYMLKQQSRKVTINGHWDNQPSHCYTFENPCLTKAELALGQDVRRQKNVDGKLQFCYVGRLERPKGVERIIKAFGLLSKDETLRVECVHLVGDGPENNVFKDLAKTVNVPIKFHGFLPRQKVFTIYELCHVFVMPTTASEGFPKVIAEAMNFGCLPIVSSVSSIGHYIKQDQNGFLMDDVTAEDLSLKIKSVLHMGVEDYKRMINNQEDLLNKFTFSHYSKRITEEILEIKPKTSGLP